MNDDVFVCLPIYLGDGSLGEVRLETRKEFLLTSLGRRRDYGQTEYTARCVNHMWDVQGRLGRLMEVIEDRLRPPPAPPEPPYFWLGSGA